MLSTTYAIQGVLYFVAHPSLWVAVLCPFVIVLVASVATTLGVMVAGFPALAVALVDWAHWKPAVAWTVAFLVALVLSALVSLILFAAIPPAHLDMVFCKTLLLRGGRAADMLRREASGEDVGSVSCCRACCGCIRVSVWIRILIALLSFPLNAIPVAGTVVWIWLNGIVLLWEYHQTWFHLYGQRYPRQKQFIKAHLTAYSNAGFLAQTLEMIPLFNWLFVWTNAVAAALMVADFERQDQYPTPMIDDTSRQPSRSSL